MNDRAPSTTDMATRAQVGPRLESGGRPHAQQGRLDVVGVSKWFHGPDRTGPLEALHSVSLVLEAGEIVSVVGPSGCGKTTLLNIIAGFEEPSTGHVSVANHLVQGPGPDRGVVFQEHALFPWMSAQDNVAFGPRVRGRPDLARQAPHYLELVGLAGFEHHYPAQLSGGMRQRVAIARVLANEPEVLLMDEPFGALDAQTRAQMHHLVLRIWEELKPTILFVTHDVDEAIFLADRVVVLSGRPGRVVADLPVGLPRPRTDDSFLEPGFLALKRQVRELLAG